MNHKRTCSIPFRVPRPSDSPIHFLKNHVNFIFHYFWPEGNFWSRHCAISLRLRCCISHFSLLAGWRGRHCKLFGSICRKHVDHVTMIKPIAANSLAFGWNKLSRFVSIAVQHKEIALKAKKIEHLDGKILREKILVWKMMVEKMVVTE